MQVVEILCHRERANSVMLVGSGRGRVLTNQLKDNPYTVFHVRVKNGEVTVDVTSAELVAA